MAIAAKIPMIATTIINSIRVKPCWALRTIFMDCMNFSLAVEHGTFRLPGLLQGICQGARRAVTRITEAAQSFRKPLKCMDSRSRENDGVWQSPGPGGEPAGTKRPASRHALTIRAGRPVRIGQRSLGGL